MIVFSALVPHSPLLIPTIGKDHEKKLAKTLAAYASLQTHLVTAAPDTIVIISPHSPALTDAITINLHEQYAGNLTEFGDLRTKPIFKSDLQLIDKLQRHLRRHEQPVTLNSTHTVDYGITIPLIALAITTKTAIIPVAPAKLDFKTHFGFGEAMKDELQNSNKRIAVIASSDLSHRLDTNTPLGFSPAGLEFDKLLQESLETQNTARLLRLEPGFVNAAAPCGFRAVLMLLGICSGISYTPHLLAYESPFGVGYLTAEFVLD